MKKIFILLASILFAAQLFPQEQFTEQTSISLTGVYYSSVAWGDYDNDGDLDILLTGNTPAGPVSKIYRNNNLTPNTLPAAPSNLQSFVSGQDVTLSWDKSTDNETQQNGLRYNPGYRHCTKCIKYIIPNGR